MNTIGAELDKVWDHLHHRAAPDHPSQQPHPAQPEGHATMSIAHDLADTKNTLQDIIDRAAAIEANPIVAAVLEAAAAGAGLPPQLEEAIAATIRIAAQPHTAAPVQPAAEDPQPLA